MKNSKSVFSCIGASNHSSYERETRDYYSTDDLGEDLAKLLFES